MPTSTLDLDSVSRPFRAQYDKVLGFLDGRGAADPPPAVLSGEYVPEVREAAQRTWVGRMVNEHRSSAVFASLVPQLIDASCGVEAQMLALHMGSEEIYHAELCARVVRAFGGAPVAHTEGPVAAMPAHAGLSALERVMRNVLFIGCLCETVAVALETEERELATEPLVRETLDRILRDEVMHARFGWVFLAQCLDQLGDDARARTADYLRGSFAYFERREVEYLPINPPVRGEIRAQREGAGLCDGATARELFYETVRGVVVPRFEQMGVAAGRAWRERDAALLA